MVTDVSHAGESVAGFMRDAQWPGGWLYGAPSALDRATTVSAASRRREPRHDGDESCRGATAYQASLRKRQICGSLGRTVAKRCVLRRSGTTAPRDDQRQAEVCSDK
jgi:hypothetical protein